MHKISCPDADFNGFYRRRNAERGMAFVVGNYAEGRVVNLQVRWTADAPPAINAEPLIISLSPWAKNLFSCHT